MAPVPARRTLSVAALMTRTVVVVDEDMTVEELRAKAEAYKFRHLPVVDRAGRLVGMVRERDVFRAQELRDGRQLRARDVMDGSPFAIGPDESIVEALNVLIETRAGCVAVIDKNRKLLGILTEHDVTRLALDMLVA